MSDALLIVSVTSIVAAGLLVYVPLGLLVFGLLCGFLSLGTDAPEKVRSWRR